MSESADRERREDWAWARTERLKAKARLLALIIRADAEGMDARATSRFVRQRLHEVAVPAGVRPLGIGVVSIWRWRVFLELENGRLTQRSTGRLGSRAALMEMRP